MVKIQPKPPVGTVKNETLDKMRIARSFAASTVSYESHAKVQCSLADQLARIIATKGCAWQNGLEIGCGTGYLSCRLLNKLTLQKIYLNDLSAELCHYASDRLAAKDVAVQLLPGDIEKISLPDQLDLVVSSSTLQWIEDLEALFAKIAGVLSDEGVFAFSLFGAGTMVEIARLAGRGLRYSDYFSLLHLTEKYFTLEQSGSREDVLFFPSVLTLFKHIRNTGVGGLQRKRWTYSGLKDFERRYWQQYGTEAGLPLSYNSHYFLARKKKV